MQTNESTKNTEAQEAENKTESDVNKAEAVKHLQKKVDVKTAEYRLERKVKRRVFKLFTKRQKKTQSVHGCIFILFCICSLSVTFYIC